MKEKCYTCENLYKQIGTHWGFKPDHQPALTDRQYHILLGFLLSDGSIGKRDRNSPRYILELSNRRCIFWVARELSNLYPNISKIERSEHKDSWRLTLSHEEFQEFADWYGSSGKLYPKNLELNSISVATWYAGDGTLDTPSREDRNESRARIKCMKEQEDWTAVDNAINGLPVDVEPTYTKNGIISFGFEDTVEILNYAEVISGYEYKWSL